MNPQFEIDVTKLIGLNSGVLGVRFLFLFFTVSSKGNERRTNMAVVSLSEHMRSHPPHHKLFCIKHLRQFCRHFFILPIKNQKGGGFSNASTLRLS